jgi:two-component system OmpR family response regulator
VLRRASRSAQPAIYGDHDDILRAGDLELDESRWTVRRGGTPVELSKTEFQLLAYLMRHQGRVLTRAHLLENVWGWDYAGESQIVETYVSYLRRKLDPLGPPLIHTQRRVGYSLRLPEHAAAHRAHQARQTWQSGESREPAPPGAGPSSPGPDERRGPGDQRADEPGRQGAEPGAL